MDGLGGSLAASGWGLRALLSKVGPSPDSSLWGKQAHVEVLRLLEEREGGRGEGGACSGRGKESDSPAGGKVKRIAGKDPEDWPRERLDILALNVFISVHRQSKRKLRVSRALPKVETVKQLRAQPSILSVFRRQWGQQKSSTLDSVR